MTTMLRLTSELLLRAYATGIFPMAQSRRDRELYWIDPEWRGILPLDRFHVPRRLRRTLRQRIFDVRVDTAFRDVMLACAEVTAERPDSWINDEIIAAYTELYHSGHAHSVECWLGDTLAGGLYGVSMGGAFFGESMFTRVTDASKVALVHLAARLYHGGYSLLDTQFITKHLQQFGAVEVPRPRYQSLLAAALKTKATFPRELTAEQLEAFLAAQRN
jgi:leucyl/phenylalanyl-tRNA--protein transferase